MQQMLSQPAVDITSPVVATASCDPPVVRVGEEALYRVTFNALETSIRWPRDIPLPGGLTARYVTQAQIQQIENNVFRPYTTFLYRIRADKAAFYTIPSFAVEVYGKRVTVPQADLEGAIGLLPSLPPSRQLIVEADTTNALVGQPLTVSVLLVSPPNAPAGLTQVELDGGGFLESKRTVRNYGMPKMRNGTNVFVLAYETRVTPLSVGAVTISAHAFVVADTGSPLHFLLQDAEPISLKVRPLPMEDQPPSFAGAIGSFSIDPPRLSSTQVRLGVPVEMTVVIRGDGDLNRLAPPPLPRVNDWQIRPGKLVGSAPPIPGRTNPGAIFSYTMIPMSSKVRTTPEIPFSYFDPEKSAYVELTIPSLPFDVTTNGIAPELAQAQFQMDNESAPEKKPALASMVRTPGRAVSSFRPPQLQDWFLALQLAPVAGFAGLWLWDRRRRYLERHPEIVRRRNALRQLRRQKRLLNRAASSGDAPEFAHRAVTAMKIASAPHFPANPRALVCSDVLSLLDTKEQQGRTGEVARRFFEAADDSSFAASPQQHDEVIKLKGEMDSLLTKLEEKL